MSVWVGMSATKRTTMGNGGYEPAAAASRPTPKKPKPGAKPAAGKPAGRAGNSNENPFEERHARDENGKFTSGPDRNKGPQEGDTNRSVQAMQTLLDRLGYGDLNADGEYGPKTADAIRRAQANHGITGETGFGPKLREALRSEYASIGGDAAFTEKGKGGSSGGGGRRSSSGAGKRGSGTRAKGDAAAKKKTTTGGKNDGKVRDAAGNVINDPSNLADGPLTPDAGRYDKPWPQEWGKAPPKYGPNGTRRAEGFKDGSAIYEGGWVWDPDTKKFRLIGQNAYAKKGSTMSTMLQFKRGGAKQAPGREHKGLPCTGGLKVLDEDDGIIEAIVSVTGIEDEVRDIIVPGAYRATLAKRLPKGVDAHDWEKPIARTLDIKELLPGDPALPKFTARGDAWPVGAGALMVKCQFNLATQQGRESYENVKFFGEEQEWSIGYNVPRGGARIDQRKGIRYINKLDLFEYSPVLFGAMPMAGTRGQKDLDLDVEVKALPGSYEELTDRLVRAIDHIVNGGVAATDDRKYVWVRATLPESVIVKVEEPDGPRGSDSLLMYPYKDVDGELVIGEPIPVQVEESLVPVDDGSDDDDVIAVTETKMRDHDEDDEEETAAAPAVEDDEDDEDDEEDEDGYLSAAELDEMRSLRADM